MGVIQSSINNLLATAAIAAKFSPNVEARAEEVKKQKELAALKERRDTIGKAAGGAVSEYAENMEKAQKGEIGPLGPEMSTSAEIATDLMEVYSGAAKDVYLQEPNEENLTALREGVKHKGTLNIYEEQRESLKPDKSKMKRFRAEQSAANALSIKQEEKKRGKDFRGGKK